MITSLQELMKLLHNELGTDVIIGKGFRQIVQCVWDARQPEIEELRREVDFLIFENTELTAEISELHQDLKGGHCTKGGHCDNG